MGQSSVESGAATGARACVGRGHQRAGETSKGVKRRPGARDRNSLRPAATSGCTADGPPAGIAQAVGATAAGSHYRVPAPVEPFVSRHVAFTPLKTLLI